MLFKTKYTFLCVRKMKRKKYFHILFSSIDLGNELNLKVEKHVMQKSN